MSDYIDFLLYDSLENSDSDDSDYYPKNETSGETSGDSQCERTLDLQFILKLYHNYYIYGL